MILLVNNIDKIHRKVDEYYEMGFVPWPFLNKRTIDLPKGTELRKADITKDQIENFKKRGLYKNGFGILTGEIERGKYKGKILNCLDFDEKGEEVLVDFLDGENLQDLSKKYYIEHHTEPWYRIHLFVLTDKPLPKLSKMDSMKCGLEIFQEKNRWIQMAPSRYKFTQYNYQSMENGIKDIQYLNNQQYENLVNKISNALSKHNIQYSIKNDATKNRENIRTLNTNTNNIKIQKPIADYDEYNKELVELVVQRIKPYYKEGSRNYIIFALSGYLLKEKILYKEAKHIVEDLCQKTNDEEKENRLQVLAVTYSKDPEKHNIIGFEELKNYIPESTLDQLSKEIYPDKDRVFDSHLKSELIKSRDEAMIDWLLFEYDFVTIEEIDELLYYKDGIYVSGAEIKIKNVVETGYPREFRTSDINEMIQAIKRCKYLKKEEFDKELNIFNFKNGLYDIHTDKLLEHTPEYYSLKQIPHTFVPNVKAPLFNKVIDEIVKPEQKDLLIESMAYTLHRGRPYDFYTILYGHGSNGKSVIIEILTELLGENNVSFVPLDGLQNNRFALAPLVGKNVNFDPEMSSLDIIDSSIIKRINSSHYIEVEEKNKPMYGAKIFAKLFFNANVIPKTKDTSYAYFRRVRIIICPNTFVVKKESELKDNEKVADPDIVQKLKPEMPGIINILIQSLKKLLKDGPNLNVEAQTEMYNLLASPIQQFADEYIEVWSLDMVSDRTYQNGSKTLMETIKPDDMITVKDEAYAHYISYCNTKGIPSEKKDPFCKMINKIFGKHSFFGTKQRMINGKSTRVWIGIRLKETNAAIAAA